MTIFEENGETHIVADAGMCVMHRDEGVPFYEVWLAEDDSIENWIEIEDVIVEVEEK